MTDIIIQAAELIKQNKPAVLCTVVETGGSTPRKANSKMLVFPDGSISGSIGGGSVEKEVIETALNAIKSGKSELYNYNLKQDLGMECGGSMQVYIEVLSIKPELLIFGGGHIGKALSNFADSLGFSVTVIDERKDVLSSFNNSSLNIQNIDYQDFINNYAFNSNTFIVIVTHQHKNDFDVLSRVCIKPNAYIGMIGSKNKVAQAEKDLITKNILTTEEIAKIDMPIGIPIKCETPEEIAISILAKLIDVKNQNIG
jgi:xanthine dehydrogenase accessory factor